MFVVQPNGMRLSCGADPRRRPQSDSSTKSARAQTQFLPRPGAGSFKRLLGARIGSRCALGFHTRRLEHASGVTKHPITALQRRRRRLPPSLKSSVE